MTGAELMSLSAADVRDIIEETGKFKEVKITHLRFPAMKMKVIKKSWAITLDNKIPGETIIADLRGKIIKAVYVFGEKGGWIAKKVIISKNGKIIDRYDRP